MVLIFENGRRDCTSPGPGCGWLLYRNASRPVDLVPTYPTLALMSIAFTAGLLPGATKLTTGVRSSIGYVVMSCWRTPSVTSPVRMNGGLIDMPIASCAE